MPMPRMAARTIASPSSTQMRDRGRMLRSRARERSCHGRCLPVLGALKSTAVCFDRSATSRGVPAPARAYLATYTYRVPRDAAGSFVIDVRYDHARGGQTMLVSNFTDRIEVSGTTPAVIEVVPPQRSHE